MTIHCSVTTLVKSHRTNIYIVRASGKWIEFTTCFFLYFGDNKTPTRLSFSHSLPLLNGFYALGFYTRQRRTVDFRNLSGLCRNILHGRAVWKGQTHRRRTVSEEKETRYVFGPSTRPPYTIHIYLCVCIGTVDNEQGIVMYAVYYLFRKIYSFSRILLFSYRVTRG